MRLARTVVAIAATALLAACSLSSAPPPPTDLAADLAARVGIDAMAAHLDALQSIADQHGGNRAEGTPGYDASVDYVAKLLRDKGFDVETPEFERYGSTRGGKPRVTVAGRDHSVQQVSLLVTTRPGGLNAVTLRPATPDGCTREAYRGVDVEGAIAVVDDAGCSVVAKHDAAAAGGAVGLLVVAARPDAATPGLFTPGYYRDLDVPVGIIDAAANAALRRTSAPVRLVLDGEPVLVKSRNVLAQTKTGDSANVVLAGAHLDSVAGGPGINDNGTGVAALLETALQLGASPDVRNTVRFAFWGSEEIGLAGSQAYVRGLDRDRIDDIALYLNFDMLGSPNPGYFTYDGDQSASAGPAKATPEGSAGIERTLAGYLNLAGIRPADMPIGDRTDYHPFVTAGVPIGGVTTGAAQRKTAVQARLWGGRADVAFDPNYHTRRDTVDNVDRHALSVMGPAVAYGVGAYARSTDGPNGVPPRDRRDRRGR
ncbi:M20/M25/M40 family metallo-hydrolase [Mycolicibacterium arseniciresistens]|uniref:M20/M25/M40 family metallo-hydrolase n=1 Tax=Mycolicibacterium arseniciresistens TaxID=3062257 RepID=A0ABT8UIY8_9MYCO|nr:M20/M25/M40 family metallo-hydrolase [Mycolicibacterium arseniciresistens]MDO3637748.1 M20/M25/M40 family metallo-hydrolase [Mycolicibacterium arseniciresistens]